MAPKVLLVSGVVMAGLLIISSQVTASEVAETAKEEQTKDAVNDQYGGGYRCRHGCCGGWYGGRCRRCCTHQSEAADAVVEGAEAAVSDQYGYRCRYDCCGGWHGGRCRRCCGHKNEAAGAVVEVAEDAVTDQYGGRCRYGCCGGWYKGRCRRCCGHKSEAPEVETETEPQN